MIKILKKRISNEKKILLSYKLRSFKAFFFPFDLNKLAKIHGSDKFGIHFYTQHYQHFFQKLKFKKINLLEIGVGGYDDPIRGGKSLRMWKSYFPFAKIISIDIYDKSKLEENRIKIYKGSQIDIELLEKISNDIGEFDIIIDDGSHENEHVIKSFEYLFPKLKIGGFYVIEDTQTSYWSSYGGSSENFNKKGTIYEFFKSKIDSLNYAEFEIENYQPNYYDKNIIAIHFFHNMIFIHKGENNEHSNYIRKRI
ncbi:MAG: class I SAM-dependent methyltransferase [Flavobacteriales bacterium]|nr:class I SAM-dependent methyltransferase [Flavobacteriales bacterium]